MENWDNLLKVFSLFVVLMGLSVFVSAYPVWDGSPWSITNYYEENETSPSAYNLSSVILNKSDSNYLRYEFGANTNITSGIHGSQNSLFFYWIDLDSSSSILQFNSSADNLTGSYDITLDVYYNDSGEESSMGAKTFNFIINATNDAPAFSLDPEYNFSAPDADFNIGQISFSGTDEELHYPLSIVNFTVDNCSKASWTNQSDCSLDYDLNSTGDTDLSINFTNLTKENVGIYNVTICIQDYYNGSNVPIYRTSDYDENKTSCENTTLNIQYSLSMNVSNCSVLNYLDNQTLSCEINVTTQGSADDITLSSYASLQGGNDANVPVISGRSWFYGTNNTASENYHQTFYMDVPLNKTLVGNWTINLTVDGPGSSLDKQVTVLVNRSQNDLPVFSLQMPTDNETSLNFAEVIYYNVSDLDFIIPDKNLFDESINFQVDIFNATNLSQQVYWENFTDKTITYPGSASYVSENEIHFTPNLTQVGIWTINFTYIDLSSTVQYETVNLTIFNNNRPEWNESLNAVILSNESENIYLNLSQNVSDVDGDSLTFSFVNDTLFEGFNLNSTTGVINFSSTDIDVGQHIVDITVSDGHLTNTTSFNFTILNVDDLPSINAGYLTLTSPFSSNINSGDIINVSESDQVNISLNILDDDLLIPLNQKNFYNESFEVLENITGNNSNLFSFSYDSYLADDIQTFVTEFTPNKTDVGFYNITLNITDAANNSINFSFAINISETQHDPTLSEILNQTLAVNETLSLDFNGSDLEDGNDSEGNLSYTYNFTSGEDFINGNWSIFNNTTGNLTRVFNESQGGEYHLNITLNDSSGRIVSRDFWIFVYNTPNISEPMEGYLFELKENITETLFFKVNHSIGDNLTYVLYLDNVSRQNVSYFGNGTNLFWDFTPNFADESYLLNKTLELRVYSNNSNLNVSPISIKQWNVSINHTNFPVNLTGLIDNQTGTYSSGISLNLSSYFEDIDVEDSNYNQSLNITVNSSENISYVVDGWVVNLSASKVLGEVINITVSDLLNGTNTSLTTAVSNNFWVNFTAPEVVNNPTSSPSGGSSSSSSADKVSESSSFEIISNGNIEAKIGKPVVIPLVVKNKGTVEFKDINLTAKVFDKNETLIETSHEEFLVETILASEEAELDFEFSFTDPIVGEYEIRLKGISASPVYTDELTVYLTLSEDDLKWNNESNNLENFIVFVEEFIVQNPECLELREILDEAQDMYSKGKTSDARLRAEQALSACEEFISEANNPLEKLTSVNLFVITFVALTLLAFVLGIGYYYFSRFKIKKRLNLK